MAPADLALGRPWWTEIDWVVSAVADGLGILTNVAEQEVVPEVLVELVVERTPVSRDLDFTLFFANLTKSRISSEDHR